MADRPRKNTQGESEQKNTQGESKDSTTDPMLLALNMGRHLAVVETGILGTLLTYTIVDEGFDVNILPEEMWKKLGQPTLWLPTFQLLSADQHKVKPLSS